MTSPMVSMALLLSMTPSRASSDADIFTDAALATFVATGEVLQGQTQPVREVALREAGAQALIAQPGGGGDEVLRRRWLHGRGG